MLEDWGRGTHPNWLLVALFNRKGAATKSQTRTVGSGKPLGPNSKTSSAFRACHTYSAETIGDQIRHRVRSDPLGYLAFESEHAELIRARKTEEVRYVYIFKSGQGLLE